MPLIIPSPEYAKRRKLLNEEKKIKEKLKNKSGKLTIILKKEINLNNTEDITKFLQILYELEEKRYFDELYITKKNQLLEYYDLLNLTKTSKKISDPQIREQVIKLYNIIGKIIVLLEKIKSIY